MRYAISFAPALLFWVGVAVADDTAINAEWRELLDRDYPFIEQSAPPPGRWVSNPGSIFGDQWSGPTGWRTRHGTAIVHWTHTARNAAESGSPVRVEQARLDDGQRVDLHRADGPSRWRYQADKSKRRWILGSIEILADEVRFIAGDLPIYSPPTYPDIADFELMLASNTRLRERLTDPDFADTLFGYLQNERFWKIGGEQITTIGSRRAGGLVADLRGFGESYIEYFLGDRGGPVSEFAMDARRKLGKPALSPEEASVQEKKLAWFADITSILEEQGWRKALSEDFAAAEVATRRDLALLEQRPEAARPEWTKMIAEQKLAGAVPEQFLARMTDAQRREYQERMEGQSPAQRLYRLAISGRASEAEWKAMWARIVVIPSHLQYTSLGASSRSP